MVWKTTQIQHGYSVQAMVRYHGNETHCGMAVTLLHGAESREHANLTFGLLLKRVLVLQGGRHIVNEPQELV